MTNPPYTRFDNSSVGDGARPTGYCPGQEGAGPPHPYERRFAQAMEGVAADGVTDWEPMRYMQMA